MNSNSIFWDDNLSDSIAESLSVIAEKEELKTQDIMN